MPIFLLMSLVLCSTFLACTKEKENLSPELEKKTVVYLAGYEGNNGRSVAKYWKDGIAMNPLSDGTRGASATGIAVSGKDVHITGFDSGSGRTIAKYWKNGTTEQHLIDDSGIYSQAYAISVIGDDVYILTDEELRTEGVGYMWVTKYWKNGKSVELFPGTSIVTDWAIDGSDIYVAGYENKANGRTAKYWKNGHGVELTTNRGAVTAIAVSGNDVYVAGYEFNGTIAVATYWKNGEAVNLTDGTDGYSGVNAMAIRGNDIHLVGYENNGAKYWKNGMEVKLSDATNSLAIAIAIDGNDVYIAGNRHVGYNTTSGIYWKNGISVDLESDAQSTYITSIAIGQE